MIQYLNILTIMMKMILTMTGIIPQLTQMVMLKIGGNVPKMTANHPCFVIKGELK